MELIPVLNTGLWGSFKHRFSFLSVFFKSKTGTSYSVPQPLGDMSCGFLSLSHHRHELRCRFSELYLWEYKTLPQESLDLLPKLLHKTNPNKSILLLNAEPTNSREEPHPWLMDGGAVIWPLGVWDALS